MSRDELLNMAHDAGFVVNFKEKRIGTLYSNSWPMAASGWGFVPSGMACCMAGYDIEKAVFVQDELK